MNAECRELEVLRSISAAGALEPAEEARLEAHLKSCAACRAARDADRELLDLVRLPPPAPSEALAMADLPSRALAELRRRERRGGLVRRAFAVAGSVAVAAAVALLLLTPAWNRSPRLPEAAPARPAQVAVQTWTEPDVDALWSESAVLDTSGSAASGDTMTDAALAAYDAGAGS